MIASKVTYRSGTTTLQGYLCHNKGITGKRPAIIVAHAWRGQDAFARLQAERLARLGYIAFAADIYGIEMPAETDDEAAERMLPLFEERHTLRQRIVAAYQTISDHPLVDNQRIGAIGFCFGGLTVIELLRSGVGAKAVVSFHGVLGTEMAGRLAKTAPISPKASGSLLLLHGHEDPLVSQADIDNLQSEMTAAKIDWSMVVYGQTTHAFSNPDADNIASGMMYNERSARRSWAAMQQFLQEVFLLQER